MENFRFRMALMQILGFFPRKLAYYHLALVPRSAQIKEADGLLLNNERLEFLGDAILDAVVADFLFKKYPEAREGFLTQVRARLVKRKHLDLLGAAIGLDLLIARKVRVNNASKHLYGNVLEAFIGAIYEDRGYTHAKHFIIRIINRHVDIEKLVKKDSDYKSRLIEWTQKEKLDIAFQTREEHSQEQKSPLFVSTIRINGDKKGKGKGSSKKEAEQQAAKGILKEMNDGNQETQT